MNNKYFSKQTSQNNDSDDSLIQTIKQIERQRKMSIKTDIQNLQQSESKQQYQQQISHTKQYPSFEKANKYFQKPMINKKQLKKQLKVSQHTENSNTLFSTNRLISIEPKDSLLNKEIQMKIKDIQDIANINEQNKIGKKIKGLNYKERNKKLIQTHQLTYRNKENQQEQQKYQENLKNKTDNQRQQEKSKIINPNFELDDFKFSQNTNNTKKYDIQHNFNKKMNQKDRFKFIIDKQSIQSQKKLNINNHTVYFPYEPYQAQIRYMSSVLQSLDKSKNAILQSPTGTGKTLCLLSATLSWIQQKYQKTNEQISIIYLSRTHSQLAQVQKQLQKTCFRPTISTFGSRQNFCIKQELNQLKGRQKVQACNKGVKLFLKYAKNQKVSRSVLQFDRDDNQQQNNNKPIMKDQKLQKLNFEERQKVQHAMCSYYAGQKYVLDLARKNFKNKIITSEKIKILGRQHRFCPYYYPNFIKPICNLFFMPYNYILDQGLISRYKQIITKSILIFDEGHNVSQAACQGKSFSITRQSFKDAKKQLQFLMSTQKKMSEQLMHILERYQSKLKIMQQQIDRIEDRINKFIGQINFEQQNKGFDDELSLKAIFPQNQTQRTIYELLYQKCYDPQKQIFKKVGKNQPKKQLIDQCMNDIYKYSSLIKDLCQQLLEAPDGVCSNIEKVSIFIEKCLGLLGQNPLENEWIQKQLNHFRILIAKTEKSWQVDIICLVPFLTFSQIQQLMPRNIIITSGTLSPIQTWQNQLRLNFPIRLNNSHVIPSQQLRFNVIQSYNSTQFNFSYKSLYENKNIYDDTINAIIQIAQNVPNGILVMVPSYKILNGIENKLKFKPQLKKKLSNVKNYFYQSKDNFDILIAKYRKAALDKKGALLFCVCRGKISEGIDFPNQLCRAVIFVGIPFPNIGDFIVKAKKQHLNKMKQVCPGYKFSGQIWYENNTFRAVSQAIGRVIRHINDYGCIFLMDTRYNIPRYQAQLPRWAIKSYQVISKWDYETKSQIKHFYQLMQKKLGNYEGKNIVMNKQESFNSLQDYQEDENKQKQKYKKQLNFNKDYTTKNNFIKMQTKPKPSNVFQMMRNNMNNNRQSKDIKKTKTFILKQKDTSF